MLVKWEKHESSCGHMHRVRDLWTCIHHFVLFINIQRKYHDSLGLTHDLLTVC